LSQDKSKQENEKLNRDIKEMRKVMFEKFNQMEIEKNILHENLNAAERNVLNQTNRLNSQLERQKIQTMELVETIEKEKQQLITQQQSQKFIFFRTISNFSNRRIIQSCFRENEFLLFFSAENLVRSIKQYD
jgi:acetyl-CoA carboxylase alpha subunit